VLAQFALINVNGAILYWLAIVGLGSVLIGMVSGIAFRSGEQALEREKQPADVGIFQSKTADTVVSHVKTEFKDGNYKSVVRLGRSLSRPLWVDGRYRERIEIGDLVFRAASAIGDKISQAWALIDDIGWTYTVEKNDQKAEENIKRGLQIAESLPLRESYLIAKGLRHLAGIYINRRDFKQASEWFDAAQSEANVIADEYTKREMLAGIFYGRADMFHKMGSLAQLESAEQACEAAMKIYAEINDSDRVVKCYALLSQIYLKRGEEGDLDRATEMAYKGLEASRRQTRRDEAIKCLIGIGKMHIKRGEYEEAKHHLDMAYKEAEKIGHEELKMEILELLKQLGGKPPK
jgi:tetratricopeptide (TPR) repeat protein